MEGAGRRDMDDEHALKGGTRTVSPRISSRQVLIGQLPENRVVRPTVLPTVDRRAPRT